MPRLDRFERPSRHAPVAQLDRASDFGSEGWGFESLRARQRGGRRRQTWADLSLERLGVAQCVTVFSLRILPGTRSPRTVRPPPDWVGNRANYDANRQSRRSHPADVRGHGSFCFQIRIQSALVAICQTQLVALLRNPGTRLGQPRPYNLAPLQQPQRGKQLLVHLQARVGGRENLSGYRTSACRRGARFADWLTWKKVRFLMDPHFGCWDESRESPSSDLEVSELIHLAIVAYP